jgi:hypothetical protein
MYLKPLSKSIFGLLKIISSVNIKDYWRREEEIKLKNELQKIKISDFFFLGNIPNQNLNIALYKFLISISSSIE